MNFRSTLTTSWALSNHLRNQTDKFLKAKNHFRNQTDKARIKTYTCFSDLPRTPYLEPGKGFSSSLASPVAQSCCRWTLPQMHHGKLPCQHHFGQYLQAGSTILKLQSWQKQAVKGAAVFIHMCSYEARNELWDISSQALFFFELEERKNFCTEKHFCKLNVFLFSIEKELKC